MFEMRSSSVVTTRRGILAITSHVLKSGGGVAFLLLFLLSALSNASATTTLTPGTVTFSPTAPTYGATVTLTAPLTGWVAAAGGTITFETATSSSGTYGTSVVTCGSTGSATVTAAASTTCQTSQLPLGTTYVKALYTPTGSAYAGGTSATAATVNVAVATLTPATVTFAPAAPTAGASVTLTATLTGWTSDAGGTITFETSSASAGPYVTTLLTCGTNGTVTAAASVTCATTALPIGTTYVKAVYAPADTTNYAGATSATAASIPVVAIPTTTTLTAPASTVQGNFVTLTANVSPSAAPSGTVTFKDGTTSVGTCTIISSAPGTCSLIVSTSSWTVSTTANSLTATYAASGNYAASAASAAKVIIVTATGTATTTGVVTLSAASPILYPTSETLSATVSAGTGTVNFMDGTTSLGTGTVTTGSASLTLPSLAAGTHSFTAVYSGDTTHDTSTSPSATSLIVTVPTTTTLTAAATGFFGTPYTMTANITPAFGSASAINGGVVTFSNGTPLGSCTISGGTCYTTITTLPPGTYTVTASYAGYSSGTITYNPSSWAGTSVTATAAPALTVSAGPYYFGAPVTLNVSGFPALATGTVSFVDGSTSLGSCSLVNGVCSTPYTTSTLILGSHTFTGNYVGNYPSASVSQPSITVITNPTTVAIPTAPATLAPGAAFTLTTTVSTTDGVLPSGGHVTFYDSNNSLGTATVLPVTVSSVTTMQATLNVAGSANLMQAGTHYIIASYGGVYSAVGSAQFGTSLSKSAKLVITSGQTVNFTVPAAAVYGSNITLSATSVMTGTSTPTSVPVTFTGTTNICTVNGTTLTFVGVGTCVVTANAGTNSTYTVAASSTMNIKVYPKGLTITAPNSPSIAYGAPIPTIAASSASISGWTNSDTVAALGSHFACGTSYEALPSNHPGPYATFCYGAVDANYDITLVDGTMQVTKATPFVPGINCTGSAALCGTYPTATGGPFAQLVTFSLVGGSAIGAFGSQITGVYAWTNPSAYAAGGTSTPSVTFKPSDTQDYNTALTTTPITVTKANPTVSWPTAGSIVAGTLSNSSALSTTAITTGPVNGTFVWTCTLTSTCVTLATKGTYTESVTFTPGDTLDYNTLTHNISVIVTNPAPTVTAWPSPSPITYGQALSSSTWTSFAQPTDDTVGTFHWASPGTVPNANPAGGGTGAASYSMIFTPTDTADFSPLTSLVAVQVNQATASVSNWPMASAITYGQPISASTLTPSANFAWTNPTDTPAAGSPNSSETVTYTPTSTNYASTSHTVNVVVYQATPTVTNWPTASNIFSPSLLSVSNLSAYSGTGTTLYHSGSVSSTVPGAFDWTCDVYSNCTSPAAGTAAQSVTFTPTDTANFTTVTGTASVTVNPCGYQDSANSIYATALNVFTDIGTLDTTNTIDVETPNQSAVCAVDSSTPFAVLVAYPTITSGTGATSSVHPDSTIYGTNAAVLAYGHDTTIGHGATIKIQDDGYEDAGSITTQNDYSAGVFASYGGTVDISDTYVTTSGNNAPALKATNNGTLTITTGGSGGAGTGPLVAMTYGTNSPALATGKGGGSVTSAGGFYTSALSAGVHASGNASAISLNGDVVTAQNGSIVEVNGNSSVTSNGATTLSGTLGDNHGIFLYYDATPADAAVGASNFTMTGGSILYSCDATATAGCAPSSPTGYQNSLPTLFSVANTTANITLTDVAIYNTTPTLTNSNGTLLTAAVIAGIPNSIGGTAIFAAQGETLVGDIIVDASSSVTLSLAADTANPAVPSTLTGTINGAQDNTIAPTATVSVTLDATSSWVVTGDSYLTSLTNAGTNNSNITCYTPGACHVYLWHNAAWVAQPGIN